MSLSVYFADNNDTHIATGDSALLAGMKSQLHKIPNLSEANQASSADIVLIDEKYSYKTWKYAEELASCLFIREYAQRIFVINHDSYARVHFPGLYVSLEESKPSPIPAIPIPYKWDLLKIFIPQEFNFQTNQLFAFRGTFHTHPVRKKICQIMSASGLDGNCEELRKAFHSHGETDQSHYISGISDAQFSLCPRGLSPSSYRLYESMQLGRCPIVISDDWVPPVGPDWDTFCLFVAEKDVNQIPALITNHRGEAEERGRKALAAWQEFFSWPNRWVYFLEKIVLLHAKNTERQSFNELNSAWRSYSNRSLYGWTLLGRVKSRSKNFYRKLIE